MSCKDKLLKEMIEFVNYVKDVYPDVESIHMIGSYLWKNEPNDIDIVLIRKGKEKINLSGYPHIELCSESALKTHVSKLIWMKGLDSILINPSLNKQELIEQLILSRKELKRLKEIVKHDF